MEFPLIPFLLTHYGLVVNVVVVKNRGVGVQNYV